MVVLISFKECFIDGQSLAIIMEFAGGGDLSHVVQHCKKNRLRVPETDVIRYCLEICMVCGVCLGVGVCLLWCSGVERVIWVVWGNLVGCII